MRISLPKLQQQRVCRFLYQFLCRWGIPVSTKNLPVPYKRCQQRKENPGDGALEEQSRARIGLLRGEGAITEASEILPTMHGQGVG
jgi:hypothetical protein